MSNLIIPTTPTRPTGPHLVVTLELPAIAAPGVMPKVHLSLHGLDPVGAAWAMGKAIATVLDPNSQPEPVQGIVGP